MKDFLSASECAARMGLSRARIIKLCKAGRIAGAKKLTDGKTSPYIIPAKFADPRMPVGRPKKSNP
jgi:predicted DNA-binding protein (UPF0251 family)